MKNKKYKVVLFDLDGTLTDPKEGITGCVAYALEFFGIHVEDLDSLCKFIGPPLTDSFEEFYGFSKEDALTAQEKYRERFGTAGWKENAVYQGIPELLEKLKKDGRKLFLATSKPTYYALQIVEHFGLTKYLDGVYGSEMDGSRVKKADVIRYALSQEGITDFENVVMVGDRKHDIEGAKAVGIDSIGVLFGYGDRAEHEAAGADAVAETVEELEKLLCGCEA